MAEYINTFLSPVTNNNQLVITLKTRQELVDRRIIPLESNDKGFDVLRLPRNANIPILFPDCSFRQVPFRLNTEAFLEYLGIKPRLTTDICNAILWNNYGVMDGEILYKQIKIHIGESLNDKSDRWKNKFKKGVLLHHVPPNTLMNWIGFQENFIADFNRLKLLASQTPTTMDYYIAEEALTKAFGDLDSIDYIFATLLRRVANLKSLNPALQVYLEENPM